MGYVEEFQVALEKFQGVLKGEKSVMLATQNRFEELKREKGELEGTIKALKEQYGQMKADLSDAQTSLRDALTRADAITREADQKRLEADKYYSSKVGEAENIKQAAQNELKSLKAEREKLEERNSALKEAIDKVR